MRVLHINQSDISGGAAIAAYRLHQGLLAQNLHSQLLVDDQKSVDKHVSTLSRKRLTEDLSSRLHQYSGLNYINILSSFRIQQDANYNEADIINFHNLHGGYFNYLAIPTLTKNMPAVFTLHDMWALTGHCSYSYDCGRWQTGCGKCPYPATYPSISRDSTGIEIKLKQWAYNNSKLTIVTPSKWLNNIVKNSILRNHAIYHIPYGLDLEIYQPLESEKCKSILGIPQSKLVLAFGAAHLTESRKGSNLLFQSLSQLPASLRKNVFLLTLGEGGEEFAKVLDLPNQSLGYASGDRLKAIFYSAADLFLFPTRADNLPLTLQESMACGTPMVSFNIGGVPELVRMGSTGYLAQPENISDMARGIIELLEDTELRARISEKCREIACSEYSLELQAKRYIKIYSQLKYDETR